VPASKNVLYLQWLKWYFLLIYRIFTLLTFGTSLYVTLDIGMHPLPIISAAQREITAMEAWMGGVFMKGLQELEA
jgi:hypothetical protein